MLRRSISALSSSFHTRRVTASLITASTFSISSSSPLLATKNYFSLRHCSSSSSSPTPPPSPPPKQTEDKTTVTNSEEKKNDDTTSSSSPPQETTTTTTTTTENTTKTTEETATKEAETKKNSTSENNNTTTPTTPPKGFELFYQRNAFEKAPKRETQPSPREALTADESQLIHTSDLEIIKMANKRRMVEYFLIGMFFWSAWRLYHRHSGAQQLGGEAFYYYDQNQQKRQQQHQQQNINIHGDAATTQRPVVGEDSAAADDFPKQNTSPASNNSENETDQNQEMQAGGRFIFFPDSNVKYITVSPEAHTASFFSEDGHQLFTQKFIDFASWLRDVERYATSDEGPFVRVDVRIAFPFVAIAFLWLMPLLGRFYKSVNVGLGAARQEAHNAIRRQQAAAETETPNKGRFRFKKEHDLTTRLSDVAGLTEAKHEVTEVIDFLKAPAKYTQLGAKLPKGILIDGPPGVGKTLMARAVAGEAGLSFVSCSGSEFDEVYVGVGAMRVRELFKSAREHAPCVVFIDEIDTFGKKRRRDFKGTSRGTINALLAELDGFKETSRILVLAATNRADILDDALTRSGRFDRKITVDLPPLKDRIDIIKVHLKPLTLSPALQVQKAAEALAALTPGCSGADLYNVCNEAAITASRLHKDFVDMECFHIAMDRIMMGLERKARTFEKHEKERLAIHEAGHVVLSWFLKTTDPIMKSSIAPRGGRTEGVSRKLPHEKFIITQSSLHERMVQRLGGYVAEEYFFKNISANAAQDLENVTQQAKAEICTYGMAPRSVGHFGFPTDDGEDALAVAPFGPEKANQIDREISELVHSVSETARTMLGKYSNEVRLVAGLLMKQESVTARDLWVLLGERPLMTEEFRKYLESE